MTRDSTKPPEPPEATRAPAQPSTPDAPEVDALVAAGEYARAAELARAAGDPARASALYERIWEFDAAAACAREAGDLPRALTLAIDARDEPLIRELADALDDAGEDGVHAAMAAFAGKRRFAEAAARAEAVGELERAIEYYRAAHRDFDAGRVLEAVGRDREAGRLYERIIELDGPAGASDEAARASLQLGLLLQRRMQHDRAAEYLQRAARIEATRDPAQRALVVSLVALGWRDAAREVLIAVRGRDPSVTAELDAFVRAAQAEAKPRGEGDDERARVNLIGGRYRVEDLVGAGGAGRVFRAVDEVSGRTVAVKVFHASSSRGHPAYERFVREAKVAGALRHPNLVEVYDFSAEQGYLVMEYMAGGSLREQLGQPIPGARIKRMIAEVLAGLELAHQRGVIHRDVKPENVFLDARGTAKLGDFGVAHLLDLGATQTGGLIGTLAYMSPEQITGAPLTIAADLYALGVTVFEALTGQLPFLGPDFVAQHLGEPPPPPSAIADGVAPGWDPVLARVLAKNPAERFDSVDAMRRAVAAVELGGSDAPAPLMLPRTIGRARAGGRADGPDEVSGEVSVNRTPEDDGDGGREPADERAGEPDDDAPRYQFETPLGTTPISQLSRAVDTTLDRSVIIERFADGYPDEPTLARLVALARGGGPFLQRALSYDRAAGVAVFEAPSGVPLAEALAALYEDRTEPRPEGAGDGQPGGDGDRGEPAASATAPRSVGRPGPRAITRLLKRLARAVAPLHEAGHAHGALTGTTVLMDDEFNPAVLAAGLGPLEGDPRPADDVAALVALVVAPLRSASDDGEAAGDADSLAELAQILATTLGASLADDERAAVLASVEALDTGEALYGFADALEIALLEARRRRR